MSEQIEPGDGWRLLGPDEVIRKEDEYYTGNNWIETVDIGLVVAEYTYRRRIPAKPEQFAGPNISTYESGPFWLMETYEEKTLLDPNEVREFAAWLVHYAEWREAQGAGK
jgi:hypothetical protein